MGLRPRFLLPGLISLRTRAFPLLVARRTTVSKMGSTANGDEARRVFPPGFKWGSATAAYQVEGAYDKGGRGMSIWDEFARSGGTVDGHTGDVACDHYHRFREDVQLMKEMGLKHYRFSISWPRIQPTGRGEANQEGIDFYNQLIDCLLENGIEPLATLYHWDLPLPLQKEFNGWLSNEVVAPFKAYARICFGAFGDRVKSWITINEPFCIALLGYGTGEHAPGTKSEDGSEIYMAGHNILLAHAHAVRVYREEFQQRQGGRIAVAINSNWVDPMPSDDVQTTAANEQACFRSMMWMLGWFADPVYKGDYPQVMRERIGARLPQFTEEEKEMLRGSCDFFCLNHYNTDLVEHQEVKPDVAPNYWLDMGAKGSVPPHAPITDMGWSVSPDGFKRLLLYIQERYQPPNGVYVTETGAAFAEPTKEATIEDRFRVAFYHAYVSAIHEAIQQGADVRGLFAWSFCDNLEWSMGYAMRFGLVHVDFDTLERTPKASAKWYARLIADHAIRTDEDEAIANTFSELIAKNRQKGAPTAAYYAGARAAEALYEERGETAQQGDLAVPASDETMQEKTAKVARPQEVEPEAAKAAPAR